MRKGLPDPQRQRLVALELLPEPRNRGDPAVLVVDRGDAARGRHLQPLAQGVQVLLIRVLEVVFLEPPGRLLAEQSAGLAVGPLLDDSAVHLVLAQVAARARDPGRVEPDRVEVLRDHRRRDVARDRVEHLLRRQRGPVRLAEALRAEPVARRRVGNARRHTRRRVLRRGRVLEADQTARGRPGREVRVRIGDPRDHAPPAEVDDLRRGESGLVRADTARDRSPAIASAPAVGSEGSNVLIVPLSRITRWTLRRDPPPT